VFVWRHKNQVLQYRKFVVYGQDEPLQIRSRHVKANAAYAFTVLKGEHYSLFIFCGDVMAIYARVYARKIDDERKGG
jgi:hypothetical protein